MMYVKMMSGEDMPDHMEGKEFVLVEVPVGSHVKFKREMIQLPYIEHTAVDGSSSVLVARKYESDEEREAAIKNTRPKVIIVHPHATPNEEYYPDGNTYLMSEKGDTLAKFSYLAPECEKASNGMKVWYGHTA